MGINRSCVQHIALDNSSLHVTLLRGVQGGVQPKGSPRQTACRQAWGVRGQSPPLLTLPQATPFTCQERQDIRLLIVYIQFSKFLRFGNLAIQKMESQPKLATSYSQKNSSKQKSRIWPPVRSFGKVGLLRFYQVALHHYGGPAQKSHAKYERKE